MMIAENSSPELASPAPNRAVVTVCWTPRAGLTWHIARRTAAGNTITLLQPYPSQHEARTAAWHFNHQPRIRDSA
ncbi:hypothetical protein [Rhodococcus marinonascens]|uniref:hypothetical protein n=1 Tax=Rhodococcus marinonascens TaxID=38311 RepID=UPI000A4BAC00|nr:hypothetical protein [Rhodococcus marinonascens]